MKWWNKERKGFVHFISVGNTLEHACQSLRHNAMSRTAMTQQSHCSDANTPHTCQALQHTATHCNTLQHTAIVRHCRTTCISSVAVLFMTNYLKHAVTNCNTAHFMHGCCVGDELTSDTMCQWDVSNMIRNMTKGMSHVMRNMTKQIMRNMTNQNMTKRTTFWYHVSIRHVRPSDTTCCRKMSTLSAWMSCHFALGIAVL